MPRARSAAAQLQTGLGAVGLLLTALRDPRTGDGESPGWGAGRWRGVPGGAAGPVSGTSGLGCGRGPGSAPPGAPRCPAAPPEVRDAAAAGSCRSRGRGTGAGPRGVSSLSPPNSGRRCPRACGEKFGGFEGSSPGRPPCPCLKDRGDIFTPQTAAPLSPPAPIALI